MRCTRPDFVSLIGTPRCRSAFAGLAGPSPGSCPVGRWLRRTPDKGLTSNRRSHRHPKRPKNFNTKDDGVPRGATEVDLADVQRIQFVLRGPSWLSLVLGVSSLPAFGRPPWMKLSAVPDLGYSIGAVGTKVGSSLVRQSPRVSWTRRPGRPPLARGSSDAPRARSLDVFFDQATTPAASVWEEKGWTSFINV